MYQNIWDNISNFNIYYPTYYTKMFNKISLKHLKSQENTKNVSILINTLCNCVYYLNLNSPKTYPKTCKFTQKVTSSDTR